VTTAKIVSKLGANAEAGLEPFVPGLYATPGRRVVGVVEFRHIERTEVVADAGKIPSVSLAITALEIANTHVEDPVRELMSALHLQRSASGTLTESGDLRLSENTIRRTGGLVASIENARLAAATRTFADIARRAASDPDPVVLRDALRLIAKGLEAAERGEEALADA
jgi:thioredoxin-like negative regulator of GroEL